MHTIDSNRCYGDSAEPTIPLDLKTTEITNTTLSISWRAPANPNGALTYYKVYRNNEPSTTTTATQVKQKKMEQKCLILDFINDVLKYLILDYHDRCRKLHGLHCENQSLQQRVTMFPVFRKSSSENENRM